MKIKVAILGGGRVCQHYKFIFDRYNLFDYFEIVAACDIDSNARDFLSSAFGCPVVSNIESLFSLQLCPYFYLNT